MKILSILIFFFSLSSFAQTFPEREALPYIFQLAKPVASFDQLKLNTDLNCQGYESSPARGITSRNYVLLFQQIEDILTVRFTASHSYYPSAFPVVTVLGTVEQTELGSENLPLETSSATQFGLMVRVTSKGAIITYRHLEFPEISYSEYIYCLTK